MAAESSSLGGRPPARSSPGPERARLRVYIGAAPGVGKTYLMLRDAHLLRERGLDVAVAFVETYGRADTRRRSASSTLIPRRRVPYRGVEDGGRWILDAVLARRPAVAIVDELAHTNVPGFPAHQALRRRDRAARRRHHVMTP